LPSVGQMVSTFVNINHIYKVKLHFDLDNNTCLESQNGTFFLAELSSLRQVKTPEETAKQKAIDENQRLREQLDAWSEKYADLKIKSDANKWAHDNMQEQLALAKVFVKAIAHVGVDFGYGPYALTETDVCNARGFLELLEGKG